MSDGFAFCEWAVTWFGLAKDLNYQMTGRDILNRGIQLQNITSEHKLELPQLFSVSNAKGLFDNMIREQSIAAKKVAGVEIAVIRNSMRNSSDRSTKKNCCAPGNRAGDPRISAQPSQGRA